MKDGPNTQWYTQARVDELVKEAKGEALREYADAVADNPSALGWGRAQFVSDVLEWADEVARG